MHLSFTEPKTLFDLSHPPVTDWKHHETIWMSCESLASLVIDWPGVQRPLFVLPLFFARGLSAASRLQEGVEGSRFLRGLCRLCSEHVLCKNVQSNIWWLMSEFIVLTLFTKCKPNQWNISITPFLFVLSSGVALTPRKKWLFVLCHGAESSAASGMVRGTKGQGRAAGTNRLLP